LKATILKFSDASAKQGELPSVQREIDWLTKIAKNRSSSWAGPIERKGFTNEPSTIEAELSKLSDAYGQFAKALSVQFLFADNLVVQGQLKIAQRTSEYLRINSNFATNHHKEIVKLSLEIPKSEMNLELLNPRLNFNPSFHIDHLSVIQKRQRIVVKDLPSRRLAEVDGVEPLEIVLDADERRTLTKLVSGRTFDGLLPALHDMHLQVDPLSGHQRLLLELSEINYSAVCAMNYPGNRGVNRSQEDLESPAHDYDRLFTLSMLPISTDGFLIVAKRSMHVGVARGLYSPGVNGNLELRDRLGLTVDRDRYDLPDPLLALAREAKEELGLDVETKEIQILGVGRFSYPEEVGTWVLLSSAITKHTADEIVELSKLADWTEGAWETDGEFLAIPVPTNRRDAQRTIRWAINSTDFVPHLTLSLLALCLPFLSIRDDGKSKTERISPEHGSLDWFERELSIMITNRRCAPPRGTRIIRR
jgi:8-oxo-dGTP pyrophosphatase MutT (NUDIX family)